LGLKTGVASSIESSLSKTTLNNLLVPSCNLLNLTSSVLSIDKKLLNLINVLIMEIFTITALSLLSTLESIATPGSEKQEAISVSLLYLFLMCHFGTSKIGTPLMLVQT